MKKLMCLIPVLIITAAGFSQTADEYNDRGDSKFILQDYAGAIECYDKAIEMSPNFALAFGSRGFVKDILRDYKGAINDITKAIELNPSYKYNHEFYFRRAEIRKKLNDNVGAILDFTRAIEFNLAYTDAYIARGLSKYELGDTLSGKEDLLKVRSKLDDLSINAINSIIDNTGIIGHNPNNADAYFLRGVSKLNLHDNNGAISDFTKAIDLQPNYLFAYCYRGDTKRWLNDYKGAINDYTKAIEVKPSSYYAYGGRGEIKGLLGDYKGAIDDYTKAIELNPKTEFEHYYGRGDAKRNIEDYNSAILDFTKAIEQNTSFTGAYIMRGLSKCKLGDKTGGCQDLSKASELGDKSAFRLIKENCN